MTSSQYVLEQVRSLVLDLGMHTTRAGFSAEEVPSFVFCSSINVAAKGLKFGYEALSEQNADIQPVWELSAPQGTLFRSFTRPEHLEALLEYCLSKLEVDPQDASSLAPLLIVDPMPAFSVETKQLIAQLVFDRFRLPGLYFASSAALSAFASGKPSALVVDMGHSGTSVVGVSDGLVTTHSWQRLGGELISNACRLMLQQTGAPDLIVHAQVESKEAVQMSKPPNWKPSNRQLSSSYVNLQQTLLLEDFKATVIQVAEMGAKGNELALKPPKFYEFPNGFNRNFGMERFEVGELMFRPQDADLIGLVDQIEKLHQATDSHAACNIVISGGGSLVEGLTERVISELHARLPRGYGRGALKITNAATNTERRHAAWIGGSILTSIGTFHKIWVAPQEFAEVGLAAFDRRPYVASIIS
jgi:actin-related protein